MPGMFCQAAWLELGLNGWGALPYPRLVFLPLHIQHTTTTVIFTSVWNRTAKHPESSTKAVETSNQQCWWMPIELPTTTTRNSLASTAVLSGWHCQYLSLQHRILMLAAGTT